MSNIIQLEQYKRSKLGKNSFKYWNSQFHQSFNESTTICDLPDNILLFLASPGDKSEGTINQLIRAIRFPKDKPGTKALQKQVKMMLMDIHLFLLDRLRLEMLLRLGWIDDYPGKKVAILDLILNFSQTNYEQFKNPLPLAHNHPRWQEYNGLIPREKELFIRRLFVNALIEFNRKLHES
jgi:hypothetical protein